MKTSAFTWRGLRPNFSAVQTDNVFDDRESQAGPAGMPGTSRVSAVKTFENAFGLLGWKSDAVVLNANFEKIIFDASGDGDFAVGGGVVAGIFDQIKKDLMNSLDVEGGAKIQGNQVAESERFFTKFFPQILFNPSSEKMKFAFAQIKLFAPGFQFGNMEEIFNKKAESVDVLFDFVDESSGGFGIVLGPVKKRLGVAFNEGERSSQLVADIGNEFTTDALEFLESGDVVKDEDTAMIAPVVILDLGSTHFTD